jgi:ubiquinone/menaquinone biosynthesis C-methylase UbiE
MDIQPRNGWNTRLENMMAEMSRFWDKHAKGYAKRPVADEAAYQQKLKVTQTYLKPHMEVLEFACGTGTTALIHAPFVKHILATDISGGMLEIARAKAAAEGVENVTFQQGSIEELDAPDASFDVVMGHSILHLLEDRQAVIQKVHRLLKPGGIFVTSTACLSGKMAWLRLVLPVARLVGLAPPVEFFSPEELIAEMTGAGFRIDHRWTPPKGVATFLVAVKA